MATNDQNGNTGDSPRDKYRDNDDARGVTGPDARNSVKSDSKFEARGDARDNVGNNARGTAAGPAGGQREGQHGNDKQRGNPDGPDEYDMDLVRDNHRGKEAHGMAELAEETRSGMFNAPGAHGDTGTAGVQHARKGQAESPAERTHNEPPAHKQGHH